MNIDYFYYIEIHVISRSDLDKKHILSFKDPDKIVGVAFTRLHTICD